MCEKCDVGMIAVVRLKLFFSRQNLNDTLFSR